MRAIVRGYGAGRIDLVKPRNGKDGVLMNVRYAPSFRAQGKDNLHTSASYPYTVESLMAFLGWKEHKVRAAIEALAAVEDNLVDQSDRADLRPGVIAPGLKFWSRQLASKPDLIGIGSIF